jgi:hypothetical protein
MISFLLVLFLLAAGAAIRDGAFLLSEAELMRIGSSVACLDISWDKVGDWYPRAEIGPAMLYEIVLARWAGSISCRKVMES